MSTNVLIVDDEVGILESLKTHLEIKGFNVATANSAKEALSLIEKEPFDIALMDINMPHMDGIELLEEIQKVHGEIVAIMITAYTSISKVLMCRIHGAFDYVLKPFRDLDEVDDVLTAAERHIARWNSILIETRDAKKLKAS